MRHTIDEVIEVLGTNIGRGDRAKIADELFNDVMGYGPLETLLNDPDITEIMVNGPFTVFCREIGENQSDRRHLQGYGHEMNIIDRIVSPLGRHIDEASPMVDARLRTAPA